jgi:Tol biopolymer transport system component
LFLSPIAFCGPVASSPVKRLVPAHITAGSKIAFVSDRDGNSEIYTMNPDGSGVTRLTNEPAYNHDQPAISPDGNKIAFSSNRAGGAFNIFLMNVDGSNVTQLTNSGADYGPAFSPDGSKILFTSVRSNYFQVFVINADGANETLLSSDPFIYDFDPSFSPDGSKIVFASSEAGGNYRIFVMDPDGANRVQLSDHPASEYWQDTRPSFSPDGTRIVFQTATVNGHFEILKMNADGSGLTELTHDTDDFRPGYSPDGSKIIFSSPRSNNNEIYTMNPDGSNVTNISNNVLAYDAEPFWGNTPATADLGIVSVTDSPDPVQNNGDITYTFTIHNYGPDNANHVRIQIDAINGTLISSELPYTYSNGLYTITRADAYNGETFTFNAVFAAHRPPPEESQTVRLNVFVSSDARDPFGVDNGAFPITTIAAPPPPPQPGDLGATGFIINESFDPDINAADTVLRFAAVQQARAAGMSLRVQQSTNPNDESSWSDLPDGGLMMLDFSSFDPNDDTSYQVYFLNTTAYMRGNGVYFRAIAYAPGHPDSISNVMPPPSQPGMNLASSTPHLDTTVFRIAGLAIPRRILPGQNIPFLAVQQSYQVAGLQVRVQSSTTPRDEQSWTSLPGGIMTTNCTADVDPNFCDGAATNFFHVRSSDYQTGEVYFRAISSAPGHVDSLSRAIGPFKLTRDELPQVLLTPPGPNAPGKTGTDQPDVLFVSVDANDPDGSVVRVDLYVDGRPFLTKDSPPWVFDIQSLSPGRHSLDAYGWDNVGGLGFSNHVGDYFVSNEGGFTFDRVADGDWNEATGWQPTGVPGPNDVARIVNHTVTLNGANVSVSALTLSGGRINGPGSVTVANMFFATEAGTVLENLAVNVPASTGVLFVDSPASIFDGIVVFNNVTVNNYGKAILSGHGFEGGTSFLNNHGVSTFGNQLRHGSQGRSTEANFGSINNYGTLDASGGLLRVDQAIQYEGQLITGAALIGQDGATLIGQDGATLIGQDGATLIGQDGATLIGNDGSSLIGQDGATLIGQDAAAALANDGAGVLSHNGNAFNRPARKSGKRGLGISRSDGTGPLFRLLGGTLNGVGVIQGDVENLSGSVAIGNGNSPGAIAVNGNYTQSSGGSLVMNFSGRNGQANQYDLLKISGAASLDGAFDIGPVSGATPGTTSIVPLSYGSVSGGFTTVGTNTQIAFNTTGAIITVTPPIPLAPVATAASNVTSYSFIAHWNNSSGATGYRIDVSTTSSFTTMLPGNQDRNVGSATSAVVKPLSPGVTYYYRVRAINDAGPSGNSNTVMVATAGASPTPTPTPKPRPTPGVSPTPTPRPSSTPK